MNYEILTLSEKLIATAQPIRLLNQDVELNQKVNMVWKTFLVENHQIQNPLTGKPMCTYSNYESDEKGAYDVAVGLEIIKTDNQNKQFVISTIPAGKYAKFIVKGQMPDIISDFWKNLWKMDLNRKFSCDFEAYETSDPMNAEVHIFIALQ